MVQWFDKSSASAGSYKDSVRSLAKSFLKANSPERSPVPVRSTRRNCYSSDTSSNSYHKNNRIDDNISRRVTSPAYSQSTNSSDGSSDYGYSSRPSTPVMSHNVCDSRASTPVMSYSARNSRAGTPVRYNNSDNHNTSNPIRKYSSASSRCDTPIRYYENAPSRSTTPMRSASSRCDTPIRYYENAPSRSTTPMRSFCTPSSRPTTPLGSYYSSNSRSGTPLRSTNGYISRDSSPTPTVPTPNESILNPIRNRPTSTNGGDLPLPKSRAEILVPLKYYFTDVPNNFKPGDSIPQCSRSSSRSRSVCKEDEPPSTNNVTLRQRSSSANRSSCYGEILQSRPRDLPLPRPRSVYSLSEQESNTLPRQSRKSYIESDSRASSVGRDLYGEIPQSRPRDLPLPRPRSVYSLSERESNTLPRQSRKSYIESDSRASSVGRDMFGSSESLQNLIHLPSTKDIETRVRASRRCKLSLPSISSDNARSRKARSQYLSGVTNGNHYKDENGVYHL